MFKLVRIQNAQMNVPEPEYLPAAAESFAEGEALVVTGGKLTKAGATVTPTFIAGKDTTIANAGDILPAYRVERQQVWEAPNPGAVTIGAKVTLEADGLGVTATTTSGVATITEVFPDVVHVMFR